MADWKALRELALADQAEKMATSSGGGDFRSGGDFGDDSPPASSPLMDLAKRLDDLHANNKYMPTVSPEQLKILERIRTARGNRVALPPQQQGAQQ